MRILRTTFFLFQFILILVSSESTYSQLVDNNLNNSIHSFENFRIYPSNVIQTEPVIVHHPSNPDILFASANAMSLNPFFISEGIYVSTNGGNTWFGSDTCSGEIIESHGGDPGITINKDGTFILTRKYLGGPALASHYSMDYGMNWSDENGITSDDFERAPLTSDVHPSSLFFGRSYAVWVSFVQPFSVKFSYTDNGGVDWSSPAQINNPIQRSSGGEIAMGPQGRVYVCWAGIISTSPFYEDFVGFASTTNGGNTWQVTENAFDVNGIRGILSQKNNIRVNGLPVIAVDTTGGPRDGWIYIVTAQKNLSPAGSDPDVILNRSSDNGQTWSSGIRVNKDQINNGAIQYFPAVHVDKFGGLNILFYDDRNTTSDSTGVFIARSEDGGDNWAEFEISDRNFKPVPISGTAGYQGDFISITSANGKLFPVWMDNRTGIYQVWAASIDILTLNVQEKLKYIQNFILVQNYPNPFNPTTTIKYQIPELNFVTLKLYDILGNEIETLVNEEKQTGTYEITWYVENLPSGIYFYRLQAGSFVETKKMILLK